MAVQSMEKAWVVFGTLIVLSCAALAPPAAVDVFPAPERDGPFVRYGLEKPSQLFWCSTPKELEQLFEGIQSELRSLDPINSMPEVLTFRGVDAGPLGTASVQLMRNNSCWTTMFMHVGDSRPQCRLSNPTKIPKACQKTPDPALITSFETIKGRMLVVHGVEGMLVDQGEGEDALRDGERRVEWLFDDYSVILEVDRSGPGIWTLNMGASRGRIP